MNTTKHTSNHPGKQVSTPEADVMVFLSLDENVRHSDDGKLFRERWLIFLSLSLLLDTHLQVATVRSSKSL